MNPWLALVFVGVILLGIAGGIAGIIDKHDVHARLDALEQKLKP